MDIDVLERENEALHRQNAALRAALHECEWRLAEPEQVVRAIRQGEIDALVVEEDGSERVYALQTYDSVYLRLIEECFPYGVWLADTGGKLLYVSGSFLELSGSSLEEMQEKGRFFFLPPETRVTMEGRWETSRGGSKAYDAEYTHQFADGERTIWTHGVLAQARDGMDYWVGVNIDVTSQKRNKEELRRQAEALEEAGRRKDEFLALLGHELRNPLAMIRNGLHILLRPNAGIADQERMKEMMEKQVDHLTRMVDDLLDVSRITRGRIQLRKERLELSRSVAQAIDSVRSLLEACGHVLSVSLPSEPIYLEADPTRLEQILVNLLNNAAKYTPPKGKIALEAKRIDTEVEIRVIDNGVGIPTELLPTVFDLFTQVEKSLDRSQGGLGIGLTLVKRLVELHGGSVTAHSERQDKGCEFVVRLPALARPVDRPRESRKDPFAVGRCVRVLVVDDSVDLAMSIKMLLKIMGHDVEIAHDGPSALTAFQTHQPDVILLDIGMPGMNGYEIAHQLRREQGTRHPLVVAVSGYGQDEDKRKALEAGFDTFLTKPVHPQALAELLAMEKMLVGSDGHEAARSI